MTRSRCNRYYALPVFLGLCFGLFTGCALVSRVGAQVVNQQPLSQLAFGTGWIALGVLDARNQKWATLLKHRGGSYIPRPGEKLEITEEQQLMILNFEEHAERDRLIAPKGSVSKRDVTPVILPPGILVKVEEISRDEVSYSLQTVRARVVAAPPAPSHR